MILITNDDGINCQGLISLAEELAKIDEVCVSAPDSERSATSHALTLHRPLRADEIKKGWWSVDGTPADCVLLAIKTLLEKKPRLIVSGINRGVNLADDIMYSGTFAGAAEGRLHGVQSFAISLEGRRNFDFAPSAKFAAKLAKSLLDDPLTDDLLLNVNIPLSAPKNGMKWESTRLGKRVYKTDVEIRTDPRGMKYFWIGGQEPDRVEEPDTDLDAMTKGVISITPIRLDTTALDQIEKFASRRLP